MDFHFRGSDTYTALRTFISARQWQRLQLHRLQLQQLPPGFPGLLDVSLDAGRRAPKTTEELPPEIGTKTVHDGVEGTI